MLLEPHMDIRWVCAPWKQAELAHEKLVLTLLTTPIALELTA